MVIADAEISLEQPLLTNKKYYNLSIKRATYVQNLEDVASTVPGIVMLILSGYIYEICGRKKTLFFAFTIGGICLFLNPIVSPNIYIFVLLSVFFDIGTTPIGLNTLILDYVAKKDRGKAIAYNTMAVSVGVIVSMQVLFNFTKDIDPLLSWGIIGAMMVFTGILMYFTVDEPKDIKEKKEPLLKMVKNLTVNVFKALKKNPHMLMGWLIAIIVAAPISVFEIYIMSWLGQWYKDDGSGPFKTMDDLYFYYQWQATIGSIIALALLAPMGFLIDKINLKVMLPITLII
jgi:MFS family permease